MLVFHMYRCDFCGKEEALRVGLGNNQWKSYHALDFCSRECLRRFLDKQDDSAKANAPPAAKANP
jgi:hypothetical protein